MIIFVLDILNPAEYIAQRPIFTDLCAAVISNVRI